MVILLALCLTNMYGVFVGKPNQTWVIIKGWLATSFLRKCGLITKWRIKVKYLECYFLPFVITYINILGETKTFFVKCLLWMWYLKKITCHNFTCDFSGSTDFLQHLGGACAIEKKVKVLEDENLKLRLEVCELKAFIGFLSCYFEVALFLENWRRKKFMFFSRLVHIDKICSRVQIRNFNSLLNKNKSYIFCC